MSRGVSDALRCTIHRARGSTSFSRSTPHLDSGTSISIDINSCAAERSLMQKPLAGKVALVAGATRGAGRGIAVQLGVAGATVYVTGRTTRGARSEMNRPETIEETAALVDAAGGRGIAI